jgi:hypothetical protein
MTLSDLSEDTILGELDEFSLYVHYLQFEPVIGCKYRSRLRTTDDYPSFGLFRRKYGSPDLPHEFMWKDQALTAPNYGDIFDLVLKIYPSLETRFNSLLKVATDFGLIEGVLTPKLQLEVTVPVEKPPAHITVKSKPFTASAIKYWQTYGIELPQLVKYNVHQVEYFFFTEFDEYPTVPRGNMFDYRVFDKHQLYQPYPKQFYMDLTPTCILGFQQFNQVQTDLLVYTKSMKDVIFLDMLGFPTLASTAENGIPSPEFLQWSNRFKRRILLHDNDGKTSEHLYPNFEVYKIPLESGEKDPTDYAKKFGVPATKSLLLNMFGL